ncbi:MAG: hypothetical protein ACLSVX_02075 [Massilimicrobiota timonensis]
MITRKKIKTLYLIMLSMLICLVPSYVKVSALSNLSNENIGFAEIDFDDLKNNSSVIIYRGDNYTVSVDVLPSMTPYDTGSSGWSGGTIPSGTHTLYPHVTVNGASYSEIGFYMTVRNKEILDVYGENVGTTVIMSVSDVEAKIIRRTPTASTPAKATMTFIAKYTIGGGSFSNYLTAEIDNSARFRLSWKY